MQGHDCACPRCWGCSPAHGPEIPVEEEYGEAALTQDIAVRIVELRLKNDPILLSSMTQEGEAMSDEAAIAKLRGEALVRVREALSLTDTDIVSALVWMGRDVDRLVHELAVASAAEANDNVDEGDLPF